MPEREGRRRGLAPPRSATPAPQDVCAASSARRPDGDGVPLLPAVSQLPAHAQRARRRAGRRSSPSRQEKARLERRLARTRAMLRSRGRRRRIGYVKPASGSSSSKGIGRLAHACTHTGVALEHASRLRKLHAVEIRASSSAARPPRREPSAASPPAARSAPCRDRAGAVRRVRRRRSRRRTTSPVRHLVAAVSRLEAAGGVERWSAAVAASPELGATRAAAAAQRRIRHELAGVDAAPTAAPRSTGASAARAIPSS